MGSALWLMLFALIGSGAAPTVGGSQAGAPRPVAAPRDAAALPAAPGAIVRGRVVAAAGGQPLHRVRITLNGSGPNPPTAVTDTRGSFELTNVPPGTYSVTAVRAGYLTIQYGQRRPRESGRTLTVQSGQTVEAIDFALPRGGVLAGRIVDELGDPSAGARVEGVELRYIRGRRVAVAGKITITNDAGEYRLSGLEPGAYQIRASSTEIWEADDGAETFAYAETYYPGVTIAERPQSVTIAVGQEMSGLDFRLAAGRAARITGVAEDATGAPLAAMAVNLDRITRTVGGALSSAGLGGTARTDAQGRFELTKLAPGEYNVYGGGPNERVSVPVTLGEAEVKHVVLTPRRATAILGSVVSDDDAKPPFPAGRLAIEPIGTSSESVLPAWGAAGPQSLRPDWTFRLGNLEGLYLFRVTGLPDEWMVKAVQISGRDITDTPTAFSRGGPDIDGLRIVLSKAGATINGDVVTAAGAASADATVIVFAEDRARWGEASRFVRAVRPDDRGRFAVGGLPPGVYRVAARDVIVDGAWEDPSFLQSLMKDSNRIDLSSGTSERVTLTLERRP